MELRKLKRTAMYAAAALTLGMSSAAQAALTIDGVTFTTSYSGNTLLVEIDAAGRTGGWAIALTIGELQVKDIGTFSSVTVTGPGAASGWSILANELNANGCSGGTHVGQNACAFGSHVALTDDMVFQFTFTGGNVDLTDPHLKLAFYGTGENKVGSLLSENVAAQPVPEPGEWAMLLAGLGVGGMAARWRRR